SHNNGLKPYLAADGLEPDVVLLQSIELFAKKLFQQSHQGIDFKPRAFPVLGGKGIEGQVVDTEPGGGFDGCANRFGASAMPRDPGLIAASGPAAVAVHYDRYVGRQPVEVYLSQKKLVSGTAFDNTFKVFKYIITHQILNAGQTEISPFSAAIIGLFILVVHLNQSQP